MPLKLTYILQDCFLIQLVKMLSNWQIEHGYKVMAFV